MRKPYGARIHARRPSDDGCLRFRIVLGKLRAIICLHKKLGGTAFATPPYKTRGFFYLDSLCLTGTSRQSASPKKPWPIGWRHWRARDCSFRAASPRGPLDSMMCFSSQTPSGTSCACRYINMAICLMRGSFILAVLTRCDSPASAKALMTAASAPILASTTATPFKMSERYRSDDVSR